MMEPILRLIARKIVNQIEVLGVVPPVIVECNIHPEFSQLSGKSIYDGGSPAEHPSEMSVGLEKNLHRVSDLAPRPRPKKALANDLIQHSALIVLILEGGSMFFPSGLKAIGRGRLG
jgi:hypothetical protein